MAKQNQKPKRTLTTPLDFQQARNMAKSEARAEYGPTIRAAKAEKRGSVQRQKNIGQVFQGLQNQIQESAAQTDSSYGQANAALLAHMNAAQQAAAQSQGQIAQNNIDMTKLTGADPSLTAPTLQEGAAAANQRNITMAALAAPISQAGASQAAYLRNTGINARREGIDQKLKEAQRRDLIGQDLTALRKERAQKAIGNFRGIRGEERDYGVQRAAFNLDKKEGEQQNALDWYNADTARRNSEPSGNGQAGGRTPSEIKGDRRDFNNAYTTAQQLYQAAKTPPTDPKAWAAWVTLVAKETGVDAQIVKKAVAKLRKELAQRQKSASVGNAAGDVTKGVNPF